jgi:hypothetical protein
LIFFAFKKKENLRFYVNYKDVNNIIIKNYYLLFLFNNTLNRFFNISIFLKLDFCDIYYYIKIKKSNK